MSSKIAGQPNFYGNLADEELGRSIMPPPKAKAPDGRRDRLLPVRNFCHQARHTFFRLEMRTEGVREWNRVAAWHG
ncbi:MAG: hypothetical protein IPJ38_21490 [Dechloromonas sp.]|uniref:Uncharacterized protein n=1 Tax=Candidatus Dechloromonas phosphorivorans TaxID=2899244 RepID=A0A935K2X0_9RHOO|nr:hypothetical protein [Candidatus Dechloromonas phosphorivorans]